MRKTLLILQPRPLTDVPPPPPTPTNEALMAAIKEHDGAALWTLYNRHSDFIRSVIARCIADEDACEDVLREVFEEIRDRAGHYSIEMGRALGWITTLARRRAMERASRMAPVRETVPARTEHATAPRRWTLKRSGGVEVRGFRPAIA